MLIGMSDAIINRYRLLLGLYGLCLLPQFSFGYPDYILRWILLGKLACIVVGGLLVITVFEAKLRPAKALLLMETAVTVI
jgi:hypothetical protein